ncbi:MAG: hypothetical protein KTR24_17275 [Saprospiraceae bacterium]|nr:hypothetical protein [Saprospiraceae bacterium]
MKTLLISTACLIFISTLQEGTLPVPLAVRGPAVSDTLQYIFLGHTYEWHTGGNRIDPRIVALDPQQYDRIWLGGDICSEAMLYETTLQHIDEVFDLSKATTQYALGNHDIRNGNIQWYHQYTGRRSYNHHTEHGLVSVCLNSMLNTTLCQDLNLQYQMLKNICDTISHSKHLVVFHHLNLWADLPDLPPPSTYSHHDARYWTANCDSIKTHYRDVIYPMLKEVRARGIKVYCIVGDTGSGTYKGFHTENRDSIHFFASGVDNSRYADDPQAYGQQPADSVLIFKHDLGQQHLTWEFVPIQ